MARESIAEFTTLFVAEIGEKGVWDDVVGDAEVVHALREIVSDRADRWKKLADRGVPGRDGRSG